MDQNSWDHHQLHVLAQLEDLKNHAEKCDGDNLKIRDAIGELRADLASFKTHQKWELRILSAIWGFIMLGANHFFGRHE
jgi:hypothetical protein